MATPEKIIKFYQSKRWKRARALKKQLARGICERCGQAGWEVHHKIPLTLANVDDQFISIGLDNLELLCTSCHDAARTDEKDIRNDIVIDEFGNVYQRKVNDITN